MGEIVKEELRERFGFIRGGIFEGLLDYKKSKTLKPKKRKLEYPIQLTLYGEGNPDFGLRTRLGRFFEILCSGFYGGRIKQDCNISDSSNGFSVNSQPDLIHLARLCIREIKGVSPGESLKLSDEQIVKYFKLQTSTYFEKSPEIRFEIFRHGVRELQTKYGLSQNKNSLDDLIEELSGTTKFLLSLPFSVVFSIYSLKNKFTSRHDNEKTYLTLTRLNSSGLNNFLVYPEETLNELLRELGEDATNFIIERKKSPRISINQHKLKKFPILKIYEKNKDVGERIIKKIFDEGLAPSLFYNYCGSSSYEGGSVLSESELFKKPYQFKDEEPF
ncbi:MAG: hypothetical protein AABW81_00535 [Nanoarchaeota archaeon]